MRLPKVHHARLPGWRGPFFGPFAIDEPAVLIEFVQSCYDSWSGSDDELHTIARKSGPLLSVEFGVRTLDCHAWRAAFNYVVDPGIIVRVLVPHKGEHSGSYRQFAVFLQGDATGDRIEHILAALAWLFGSSGRPATAGDDEGDEIVVLHHANAEADLEIEAL